MATRDWRTSLKKGCLLRRIYLVGEVARPHPNPLPQERVCDWAAAGAGSEVADRAVQTQSKPVKPIRGGCSSPSPCPLPQERERRNAAQGGTPDSRRFSSNLARIEWAGWGRIRPNPTKSDLRTRTSVLKMDRTIGSKSHGRLGGQTWSMAVRTNRRAIRIKIRIRIRKGTRPSQARSNPVKPFDSDLTLNHTILTEMLRLTP